MAATVKVTNTGCLYWSLVFLGVIFATTSSSTPNHILPIPHDATPGYIIVRVGCSNTSVHVYTNGVNSGEFNDNFVLDYSGDLIVKKDISQNVGKTYTFEIISRFNCYSNFPSSKQYTITVIKSSRVHQFRERGYNGVVSTFTSPGSEVLGLDKVSVCSNVDSCYTGKPTFSLTGKYSKMFSLSISDSSVGCHTIRVKNEGVPERMKKGNNKLVFLLEKRCGQEVRGFTNIIVLVTARGRKYNTHKLTLSGYRRFFSNSHPSSRLTYFFDQIIPTSEKQIESELESSFDLNKEYLRLMKRFPHGDVSRRRFRRQTTKTYTVPEDKSGVLFIADADGATGTSYSFRLVSVVPENIFLIDSQSGEITVKSTEKLDFDFGPKDYTLDIEVLGDDVTTVLSRKNYTLFITNVNDERPSFKTEPTPYRARLIEDAPAGTSVFTIHAEDPDGSQVVYFTDSGSSPLFEINRNTGVITNTQPITSGSDFIVKVYAMDSEATEQQKTDTADILIRRGYLAPQFLAKSYVANVEEKNQVSQTFKTYDASGNQRNVEVINFQSPQGGTTTYKVREENQITDSTKFAIENGDLKTLQSFDYEKDSHQFKLVVTAIDSLSVLSSSVSLIVNLIDKNEYKPLFTQSTYTKTVLENLSIGQSILQVSASDQDANTKITYSVNLDLFSVESKDGNIGILRVAKNLDYDKTPDHDYRFTIIASDNGVNPFARVATATVIIQVTNVNDNAPIFESDLLTTTVTDDLQSGETVMRIRAVDADGDGILYYFEGKSNRYSIFHINSNNGEISIADGEKISGQNDPNRVDVYTFTVIAEDDGECCDPKVSLSTSATATVNIVDKINQKPTFTECNDAEVLEEQEPGALVTKVSATDNNRGENGVVEYFIQKDSNSDENLFFKVNQSTGEITTTKKMDRESMKIRTVFITIRAQDKGQPPMVAFCVFKVIVKDINDNDPVFGARYEAQVLYTVSPGTDVLTIKAEDQDLGVNSLLKYTLIQNSEDLFSINEDTGVISVAKQLPTPKPTDTTYINLIAKATDSGSTQRSSTVEIVITLVEDQNTLAPVWDEPNLVLNVDESFPVDTSFKTLTAQSKMGSMSLSFLLVENSKVGDRTEFFQLKPGNLTVNLTLYKKLDYKENQQFTLHLRAIDDDVISDNYVTINVDDANDEVPLFRNLDPHTGQIELTVQENKPPGTPVANVFATDADVIPPFNKITYELCSQDNFVIDSNTGIISTAKSFDREQTMSRTQRDNKPMAYEFCVKATDGAPSSRPFVIGPNVGTAKVRVTITDVNDEQPWFSQISYTAFVDEDVFIGHVVIQITAQDLDEATFTYKLDGSKLFDVRAKTGEIYVAGYLDYELGEKTYDLTLTALDGVYSATTTVKININDTNDNVPKFGSTTYEINNITENVAYNDPILQVHAVDPDVHRAKGIEYAISQEDDLINKKFRIDSTSGKITLIESLDRDKPEGRAIYQFSVMAIDEPGETVRRTGYATVKIIPIDINDNSPEFVKSSLEGFVPEHSPEGTLVMTISAIDNDEGLNAEVIYAMKNNSQKPSDQGEIFTLNSNGKVVLANGNTDREKISMYTFEVIATDRGNPAQSATATATVNIKDINDNKPKFTQKIYQIAIPETDTGRILTVEATDPDTDDSLDFKLSDTRFFSIKTEGDFGVLEVYNNPDYEEASQRFFNLTVTVQDSNRDHTDTAYIEITIEDVNDEVPKFDTIDPVVSVIESAPVGTHLKTLTATDRDGGKNGEFDYYISGKPADERPSWYFAIDSNGNVTIKNPLDRETISTHIVKVLAIDRGYQPNTGTATLTVNVEDINDEYPRIKGDQKAQVLENSLPQQVAVLQGEDPDGDPYGAPFTFALPCNGQCKGCSENPTCGAFSLEFNPSGDNGNGEAIIRSLRSFDREVQKYFYMPIIMTDMRDQPGAETQRLTATNTFTIEIGDINDNPSSPGTQNILVYNYKGAFSNIEVGLVHYEDKDDHDRGDKRFNMDSSNMAAFFSVATDTGVITMLDHVAAGKYEFKVRVADTVRRKTVVSKVIITVEELPEEAPYQTGSVRLSLITPEEFIAKDSSQLSSYDRLRKLLADDLGVKEDYVQVINVQSSTVDGKSFTDVRYAAHGSPYYSPSKLNGIVMNNKDRYGRALNAKIEMVGIDECLREICEGGGCFNRLTVYDEPSMVNTGGQSIVGVKTSLEAECGCPVVTNVTKCVPDYCLNGGTCSQDWFGVLTCQCNVGFDGPRCQQTKLGFDGSGYALVKTMQQCENSLTSVEFITDKENALLMYNGPVEELQPQDPIDFFALQLKDGYPQLLLDHGTGPLGLQLNGQDSTGSVLMGKLNDGKWHHIQIRRQRKLVTLTVDYCMSANNVEGSIQDRSACEISGYTAGENYFLNVHTPLQLGGRFSSPAYPKVSESKFEGCMRNIRHNGELYDLHTKGFYRGVKDSCSAEDMACRRNSANMPERCVPNGVCHLTSLGPPPTAVCSCNPGYRGADCETGTTVQDLRTNSFMAWELQSAFSSFLDNMEMDIQLMYRSRDMDGVLYHVTGTGLGEFVKIEIVDNKLQVLYNLGDGNQILSMSGVPASDAQWHTLYLKRKGRYIILSRDGQEGLEYVDTLGYSDSRHQELEVKGDQIYAGAEVSYEHSRNINSNNPKDLTLTCLNDIRLQGRWFPMTMKESFGNNEVKLLDRVNVASNCIRDDCSALNEAICASQKKVCRPMWGAFVCVCPAHQEEVGSTCRYIDYCSLNPCHSLSTCVNNYKMANGYKCICPSEYTGPICNELKQVDPEEDTSNAALMIALIVVLVIIVIALIIGAVIFFLRRRGKRDDEAMLDYEKEDYDIRENIVDYDEEGAGEDDHEGYDINRLRKPADITRMDRPELMADKPVRSAPPEGHIGDFIHDRLNDTNLDPSAPPYDTLRDFQHEGGGSDAGSLSSLNTSTTDASQDYDYLNEWGPKFAKLADMYNNYDDSE